MLQKTINKKVENAELFFKYVIINRVITDHEALEDIINKDLISEFLCHTEIVTSKSSMKQMCTSLKNLISLLHHEYGYYQNEKFSLLNKLLTKSNYFLKCLEKNQN